MSPWPGSAAATGGKAAAAPASGRTSSAAPSYPRPTCASETSRDPGNQRVRVDIELRRAPVTLYSWNFIVLNGLAAGWGFVFNLLFFLSLPGASLWRLGPDASPPAPLSTRLPPLPPKLPLRASSPTSSWSRAWSRAGPWEGELMSPRDSLRPWRCWGWVGRGAREGGGGGSGPSPPSHFWLT